MSPHIWPLRFSLSLSLFPQSRLMFMFSRVHVELRRYQCRCPFLPFSHAFLLSVCVPSRSCTIHLIQSHLKSKYTIYRCRFEVHLFLSLVSSAEGATYRSGKPLKVHTYVVGASVDRALLLLPLLSPVLTPRSSTLRRLWTRGQVGTSSRDHLRHEDCPATCEQRRCVHQWERPGQLQRVSRVSVVVRA